MDELQAISRASDQNTAKLAQILGEQAKKELEQLFAKEAADAKQQRQDQQAEWKWEQQQLKKQQQQKH